LLVEQKSAGRDLAKAGTQAGEYFDALKESERPRYQLLCDFQTFQLLDRDSRDEIEFSLADLPKHVEKFGFIMGMEKRSFKDQDPVNIKAAELVGHLHDALEAGGYKGHQLEVFLTRLVFCLFADDTGIFEPRDIFLDFLETRTSADGTDTGPLLTQLFEVLDTPENKRQTNLDEDLARFPYVNGGLFLDPIRTPAFNSDMRERLIEAARFNWSGISPAIFGSLFQSVMNKVERRKAGAHYTTEKNIMKVIGPLFLDDLRTEFETIRVRKTGRKKLLQTFHDKLSKLTFMDPACGCGNFLIITYRELRLLEIDLLRELTPKKQLSLDAQVLSRIDVDQFYGIEYAEFPARIAETAMWMMDHIMNTQLSLEFGQVFLRIPLRKSPNIVHGDALELDWPSVLPPADCSFIIGNPPFVGSKEQSVAQKTQVKKVFRGVVGAGEVDFVACWFRLAFKYLDQNLACKFAFVSTKSVTQGQQVAPIWGEFVSQKRQKIIFAHQTFNWSSEARGKAHVHVIIIGVAAVAARAIPTIFEYVNPDAEPISREVKNISPYLIESTNIIVKKSRSPLTVRPIISKGSEATDFGHLTLSKDEYLEIIDKPSVQEGWFRPFWGGDEYINGKERFCLWLQDVSPEKFRKCSPIIDRLNDVKTERSSSGKPRTREWANFPALFSENRQPTEEYVIVPKVSSQRRDYIPVGIVSPDIIVSGSAQFIVENKMQTLSLITSTIHMAWLRQVGGRTKSDYQYSNTIVYNTFPMPPVKNLKNLEPFAQAILDARVEFPDATLADLYDPDTMPAKLRKAHIANDKAVDKLYRKSGFKSERERVEHLFMLYEKMTDPLLTKPVKKRVRKTNP
jgi:hypothetical protein